MHQMASTNTTTTNCAACGKEGGNLNTCNKCKMVKYCNAACKKKHRSKHKKACERRVAELHDEELFKEPPPREECPICFLPLPLDVGQSSFSSCCGKIICCGCIVAINEEARGRGKINLCAFCREPYSSSDEVEFQMKCSLDVLVLTSCLFVCLCVCLFVCLSICLCVWLAYVGVCVRVGVRAVSVRHLVSVRKHLLRGTGPASGRQESR